MKNGIRLKLLQNLCEFCKAEKIVTMFLKGDEFQSNLYLLNLLLQLFYWWNSLVLNFVNNWISNDRTFYGIRAQIDCTLTPETQDNIELSIVDFKRAVASSPIWGAIIPFWVLCFWRMNWTYTSSRLESQKYYLIYSWKLFIVLGLAFDNLKMTFKDFCSEIRGEYENLFEQLKSYIWLLFSIECGYLGMTWARLFEMKKKWATKKLCKFLKDIVLIVCHIFIELKSIKSDWLERLPFQTLSQKVVGGSLNCDAFPSSLYLLNLLLSFFCW